MREETSTQRFAEPRAELTEALGQSEAFLEFQGQLSRVAPIDRPVLILGERGTGKELAARRLHYLSQRWQEPLITLNCAMLAPSLIESELFGYQKGAFTGAAHSRKGRFEAADQGTLFLDEIGSIPLQVQEKILRVVEYGSFERVGETRSIEVNVRIVGATNADLVGMAEQGEFKRDLLDRLSFEVLHLPPLRERQGDVQILANYFASRMAYELQRSEMPRFSQSALSALEQYPWPGNIRELKNVVERAVYRADTDMITNIVFNPFKTTEVPAAPARLQQDHQVDYEPEQVGDNALRPLKGAVRELEIHLLRKALAASRYNQKEAARLLDLSYDQFRNLKRKYASDLEREQ